MTFGDVLAAIAAILATAVTLWAAVLMAGLVFPESTRRAAEALETQPMRLVGRGILVALLGVGLGLVLLNVPFGALKLAGWLLLLATLLMATLGAAGLATMLGDRMRGLAPERSAFAAMARGAALSVAAGCVPALGWLAIFPLQLFASLGAGLVAVQSFRVRARATAAPSSTL